mmetsp:Transcript_19308/g.41534  ORF Transcript_19308/g.41534 Transcript_19308/m.41534 type:complete len:514 (+) Transcript_19308:115-1656(+)|eukprot:CAMPEP_0168728320 /NCGR_PEP_ID=MMETSP0724-20121128/5624_1 /TAXON_ID=265536 /ORGANISM="Amphiprora sp., Strain CCMP467" /LENGTH=513 /DNA_ID=CAMNT_0008775163 /DNA_START=30 /DNA_END=1571 /DNA_ORIENTATION=-
MRLITGDECGLIKECIPELSVSKNNDASKQQSSWNGPLTVHVSKDKGVLKVSDGGTSTQARRNGVIDMAWLEAQEDKSFASLRINGVVQVWERTANEAGDYGRYRLRTDGADPINCFSNRKGDGQESSMPMRPTTKPIGLFSFPQKGQEKNTKLCACNAAGEVVVLDPFSEDPVDSFVQSRFPVVKADTPANKFGLPFLTAAAVDVKHCRVGVGGQERETTLWDLETSQQIWKAKNLAPDRQTLLPPQVWPSAISFLHDADKSIGRNIMAVGSAHCEVRIYDIREDSNQRRPISFTPNGLMEYRVTSICQIDPFNIVVGDSSGDLHTLDLRTLGKKKKDRSVSTMGRYVGPSGSLSMVAVHKPCVDDNDDGDGRAPLMAAAGLDRMLRIYDTSTRKQLYCMYMKQRLNCVLFGEEKIVRAEDEDNMDQTGDVDQEDHVVDYQISDDEESREEVAHHETQAISGDDNDGSNSGDALSSSSDDDGDLRSDEEVSDDSDHDPVSSVLHKKRKVNRA